MLVVGRLAGVVWQNAGATRVRLKKILLRRKHRGLWFENGKESIRLGRAITGAELEGAQALVAGWPHVEG